MNIQSNLKLNRNSLLRFVPEDQSVEVWEAAMQIPNVNDYGLKKLSAAEAALRLRESKLPHYERTILDGKDLDCELKLKTLFLNINFP